MMLNCCFSFAHNNITAPASRPRWPASAEKPIVQMSRRIGEFGRVDWGIFESVLSARQDHIDIQRTIALQEEMLMHRED